MLEGSIRPSQQVLREATQLGQTLASIDPGVVPMLDNAHEYSSYIQFIMAHRHKLSQMPFMEPWEARLQKLIEIEAKHHGLKLENLAHWDQIEKGISLPVHCAFWYGWEQNQDVLYRYQVHVARRSANGVTVQVAIVGDVPALPEEPMSGAGPLPREPAADDVAGPSTLPHH